MTATDRALSIGLVGCGSISTQHLEAIAAIDGVTLGGVVSASAERARAVGERWDVPWSTDLESLLDRPEIDAVSILTPSGLHPSQALAALNRGKHVLVEKPIALSLDAADAVVEAAHRRGLTLGTVSQRRFEAAPRALRAAVDDGAFGRLVLIVAEGLYARPQSYYDSAAWRGTLDLDGGVLMNQAIHMVDLVRWLGGPVRSVAAHVATRTHAMEAEDTAALSLEFGSGALGSIIATTSVRSEAPPELRIHGDAGHVRIVGSAAVEWDLPPAWPAPSAEPETPLGTPAGGPGPSGASATWGTTAGGYVLQYTDFLAAVRSGRPPAVSGEDGRNALEIVTAAYESALTGRRVALRGAAA
ncbi:MAG TPA: Gfo/Idh/MocA family oxidoreductase [Patescibacteria group bacterium]|nr:Gfo/Idh/MocA family oxidoreductase [Patescibacteria group bacterium]